MKFLLTTKVKNKSHVYFNYYFYKYNILKMSFLHFNNPYFISQLSYSYCIYPFGFLTKYFFGHPQYYSQYKIYFSTIEILFLYFTDCINPTLFIKLFVFYRYSYASITLQKYLQYLYLRSDQSKLFIFGYYHTNFK